MIGSVSRARLNLQYIGKYILKIRIFQIKSKKVFRLLCISQKMQHVFLGGPFDLAFWHKKISKEYFESFA